MNLKHNLIYLFICFAFFANGQFYNGSQTAFGKNRVQYNKVNWSFYKFEKFDVYYHLGGEDLALFTAKRANEYINEMQQALDFKISNKLQFLVYNNLVDFEQSNVGLQGAEQYNIGGITKVIGSKVLFYFDGNYYNFERQIKEGIARVIIDQLIYGGDIKDMVKNATLIHFPDWYLEGLISYLSEDWNTEKDNFLQDGVLSKRFLKFNHLTDNEHVLVGHSIWKYVADKYGENVLPNILYMSEITRDVDGGFLFVIGKSISRIRREWYNEKQQEFKNALTDKTVPKIKKIKITSKGQQEITQVSLNKLGTELAFVVNNNGKFLVYIQPVDSGKVTKIYKRGFKQNEFKYYENPLIAWHPSGEYIVIIDRKKDKIVQYNYNLVTKETTEKTLHKLNQVLSVSFSKNGKDLLLSAVKNGQSDIFIMNNQSNRLTQVTDDIYTDAYPSYTKNGDVIFSSDRILDSVQTYFNYRPKRNFDLFQTNVNGDSIIQITNTPWVNETQSSNYLGTQVFLSDANGTYNRYKLLVDSVITEDTAYTAYSSTAITNYLHAVLNYSVVAGSKRNAELLFQNGKYKVFVNDTLALKPVQLENSNYKNWLLKGVQTIEKVDSLLPTSVLTEDNIVISIEGVIEDAKSERGQPLSVNALADTEDGNEIPQERVYNTVFYADYLLSQLDNSLINESYQVFNPDFPVFFNPGLNGFVKVGIADLFEDKRLSGGFKLSGDLRANEYVATYSNYKNRLDKDFTLHRQSTFQFNDDDLFGTRIHVHNARAKFTYPFSRISAVSGVINGRYDRKVTLPDNLNTLQEPINHHFWTGAKLEYVFDNTVSKGLNLYYGTRAKAFFEAFTNLDSTKSYSYVLGADVRKYTKLYREIILANRIAAGTSFGSEKIIYYLGGVDGWFVPQFTSTDEIPINPDQNYVYQTIVPNLRGFGQNIRNGNSYAVANTEVRIPLFRVLSENPIASDFFYNFQVIGFYDIGTAWTGKHPFSDENSLNVKTIEKTPVTIKIDNNLDPIVQGYGFGLRSRMGGYFIRADWGFGIEKDKPVNKQFYLSLSLDF